MTRFIAEKNTIENMMVQLLFKNKPKSHTTEQLRKALEKYLGGLGEVPYVEPSGESSGNMFMFPVSKYTAAFEDKPDGVPVIATFLSSETDSGIDVDDMKRRQFWDVPNGNDSMDEDGNMQMTPQWTVQYEDSIVEPLRTVLDIRCGEYAGGNR